jgi:hypothetical protein
MRSTGFPLIKFTEPYSSTKGTLREEVCSRLIKPTTHAYLSNVRLLTRFLTYDTIVQTRIQHDGRPTLSKTLKLWYHDKVYWVIFFFFTKGILKKEVYSKFIKSTAQKYLDNVKLVTPITIWTPTQMRLPAGLEKSCRLLDFGRAGTILHCLFPFRISEEIHQAIYWRTCRRLFFNSLVLVYVVAHYIIYMK